MRYGFHALAVLRPRSGPLARNVGHARARARAICGQPLPGESFCGWCLTTVDTVGTVVLVGTTEQPPGARPGDVRRQLTREGTT